MLLLCFCLLQFENSPIVSENRSCYCQMSKKIRGPETAFYRLLFSTSRVQILHLSWHSYIQRQTYVNVCMKWKKDSYFDSIDSIHKSCQLKPIISMKNFFISSSSSPHDNYSIPISAVSKKGLHFGLNVRVASFLRSYPSIFQEFSGPLYNLPWFRLTQRAVELNQQERMIYEDFKDDILGRLKKLILMSGGRKVIPMTVIKGLHWYLGLPDEFWDDPSNYVKGDECFHIVDIKDGLKGLAVFEGNDTKKDGKVWSIMQKNAMKKGLYGGGEDEAIAFPLFPSKGLRLKQKISDWLNEFQSLPYVSPYDDPSYLRSDSDLSEKRVVGLVHELLSLFVEHAAERKTFLFLRKCLCLPQKIHKAFERHPHMFYLSMKNKTCTVILKEAYCNELTIEPHPLAEVRTKYIDLMKESVVILRNRRLNRRRAFDKEDTSLENMDGINEVIDTNRHYA